MIIPLINLVTDKFETIYDVLNVMISLWNENDVTNLQTITKVSLLAGINEVNSKKVPFYLKDSNTKSNVSTEV